MESTNTLSPPLTIAAGKRMPKIILVSAAFLYGIFLFLIPLFSPAGIYNSPDETANVVFIEQIAKNTRLRVPVIIKQAPDFVTPRGLKRDGDTFAPVSFVGFPVAAGLLFKIAAKYGFFVINAALGMLAILTWYGFCRRLFGATVGLYSAILLALHPAVLYWGTRPFYSHALHLNAIIFALYLLARALRLSQKRGVVEQGVLSEQPTIAQPLNKKRAAAFFSGFFAALAFVLRPPETIWLAPVFLFIFARRNSRAKISVLLCVLGAAIPALTVILMQNALYGSWFRTGYPQLTVLPLDFNFIRILEIAYQYILLFPWYFTVLVIIGLIVCAARRGIASRRLRFWALGALVVALFLLQFYGSLDFKDRLDLLPSIGTSFTRYFLVLYLLLTPIAAYGLRAIRFIPLEIGRGLRPRSLTGFTRYGRWFVTPLFLLMAFFSLRMVLWSSDESVLSINSVLRENIATREAVLDAAPQGSIILTERSDKIFFPYYEVVARFRDLTKPQFEALKEYPLYYETFLNNSDVEQENIEFWQKFGLRARMMLILGRSHTLYKLDKI